MVYCKNLWSNFSYVCPVLSWPYSKKQTWVELDKSLTWVRQ